MNGFSTEGTTSEEEEEEEEAGSGAGTTTELAHVIAARWGGSSTTSGTSQPLGRPRDYRLRRFEECTAYGYSRADEAARVKPLKRCDAPLGSGGDDAEPAGVQRVGGASRQQTSQPWPCRQRPLLSPP